MRRSRPGEFQTFSFQKLSKYGHNKKIAPVFNLKVWNRTKEKNTFQDSKSLQCNPSAGNFIFLCLAASFGDSLWDLSIFFNQKRKNGSHTINYSHRTHLYNIHKKHSIMKNAYTYCTCLYSNVSLSHVYLFAKRFWQTWMWREYLWNIRENARLIDGSGDKKKMGTFLNYSAKLCGCDNFTTQEKPIIALIT